MLIRKKALQYLARREHTRGQLERKLLRHGAADEAAAVLDRLESEGFLSESRYLEDCIRTRARRLYGPDYIAACLCRQGFDRRLVEQGLRAADIDWLACAERFYAKRFARGEAMSEREKQRCIRSLQRRGYREETIQALIGVPHEEQAD